MLASTFLAAVPSSPARCALFPRHGLCLTGNVFAPVALALLFCVSTAFAQPPPENASQTIVAQQQEPNPNAQRQSSSTTTSLDASSLGSIAEVKQSKRILWIFPNYRAVSATTQLPPLSLKEKFWLATQDSFDYSSFVSAGILASVSQANKSYPEFGQGAKGYGRYYWHTMSDQAVGNYLTEAIVPAVTHEDPRYYTLGHGGFFKRSGYAVSRLLITRTDGGSRTFNFAEIVGNGAGAGISDTYYPARERTWTKTGQKWVTQVALDGVFNILKEFWPNINHAVFHSKYWVRGLTAHQAGEVTLSRSQNERASLADCGTVGWPNHNSELETTYRLLEIGHLILEWSLSPGRPDGFEPRRRTDFR